MESAILRPIAVLIIIAAMPCLALAGITPSSLQCEERTDPSGIDETTPSLSWQLNDTGDERGQYQTAYRIQVASSLEILTHNQGDLWDTGQVSTNQTTFVPYQGSKLVSRETCYWHVQVWDKNGRPSHWSSPASWSMGLLQPDDWEARWISDPDLASPANRPLTPIHCYRSQLASDPNTVKCITLDLGSIKQMDAVDLIPARPRVQNSDFRTPMFPVRFKIETAEDPDFTNVQLVVDHSLADFPNPRHSTNRFEFKALEARYVRLTVTRLSRWDGQEYGMALANFSVLNGSNAISIGAAVECSDSIETDSWSKRYLVSGHNDVALANDSPAIAAGVEGVPAKSQVSRVPMLRREFDLAWKIKKATLYATARGFYEVRINGQSVGDELLAPGFTDYDLCSQYQTYDVTKLLHQGANAIGALLGYGWYAGHMNLFNNRCIYGYFPNFLAQLEVELNDGTRVTISSDDQWRSTLNGPVRWSDLLDGEGYDCRREITGWDQPGFDDHAWKPVWSLPRDKTALVWQRSQPVRKIGELKPVAVKEVKPGTYVFDFGQEISGWCRLMAHGTNGTHIRVRHAELVSPDGNLDMKNLWGTAQEEDYYLDGHGSHVLEPHFTYHGFRYAELSGFPGKPGPDTLVAVNLRTDAAVSGHFECSNDLYNRIQKAAFWTQANLLFDVPAGCAARSERLAWTGDIRPCVQALLYNFDAAPFLTKYAQDLRQDQTIEGRFTDICPHAHLRGTRACVGSPGWADAGVSLPWQVYVNTGDRRLLARHFEAARRWVDFVHANNPDLIWKRQRGNDWGDWLSAGPATPKELGATAFFAHSADLVSRMALALRYDADAQKYHSLFQDIRQAFVKNYVNTNGIIGPGADGDTQGSYALALQFGLLDEPLRSKAAHRLEELAVANSHHPTTGFWSSIELLLSLSESGHNDEAALMLNQREKPSWGYMADHRTTMWEAFDADSRNLSLNHWTHSAVNEWLWRNVAGLNPDEDHPGYRSFFIQPRPTREVSWCRASYNSISGQIVSNWKRVGNKFTLEITVPVNTTAILTVPAAQLDAVNESDKPAAEANGVTFLRYGSGAAVYRLASGCYRFNSIIGLENFNEH